MLKKENFFSSKDYFFFVIDIFYSNNCINNGRFIGSNFLKNVILHDILCINESVYDNNSIFVYSKLYLDHLKLKFFSNFLFLKGKNIYYIFIFNEYFFSKFFIRLISYNNNFFKANLYSKYGMYIQPMYLCVCNSLYISCFSNFSSLALYNGIFLFFEKYLYINRVIYSNILYRIENESIGCKYYLFALCDILLYYMSEYVNIVYLLI